MKTGISSSCFYPKDTCESLKLLGEHGVKNSEIFLNTFSELDDSYVSELEKVKEYYGMNIPSIHPFTSGIEPMMFFTEYKKRLSDGLDLYSRYFETAQRLGAKILVFHGDKKGSPTSNEMYAERYLALYELGQKYSVTVCQEDVPRCKCSDIEFILDMRKYLGEKVAFTADFKQAIRSGMDVEEMIRAMGDRLLHVHISDSAPGQDCLAPSKGNADFDRLLGLLVECSNAQNIMIELYSKNFSGIDELIDSLQFLNKKLDDVMKKYK